MVDKNPPDHQQNNCLLQFCKNGLNWQHFNIVCYFTIAYRPLLPHDLIVSLPVSISLPLFLRLYLILLFDFLPSSLFIVLFPIFSSFPLLYFSHTHPVFYLSLSSVLYFSIYVYFFTSLVLCLSPFSLWSARPLPSFSVWLYLCVCKYVCR